MTRFAEIQAYPDSYRTVPQVPKEDVEIVSTYGFYEGPLTGILRWNHKRCWFQFISLDNDEEAGWNRRFVIVELTEDQLLSIDCDLQEDIKIDGNQVLGWFEI